ncbi:rhomboid family intramembrane serine protease [Rubripirellula reticaptiva]|uniref:Rhomboid family protein n=1 Tax=Rubripirellula reticaptiva TaxID=2528013 RepID=A0A5C6EVQ9_9BACT|nr:rhomboid family intramembrane serine protease [Rubripirellula reticaptiva]TWU51311.1 Rhomboid family protein [Rubripirellula reticaptiva]
MFFIYGTDAPLYHYPIVTSVMVVINVVVHWAIFMTGVDVTPWILAFGDGYHPIQMVTHNFLHMGWFHLIGNMLFLFPFGLVVEGKIGWARMLALYMAIGTVQGFTQQTMMLPFDTGSDAAEMVAMFDSPDSPLDEDVKKELKSQWRKDLMQEGFGSLGASAVIFGLLAVCVIWAPSNNFDVYFRWGLFMPAPDGGIREWAISTVCAMFVAKEMFMFWLMGMPLSSEALHLNGFIVGAACGAGMLVWGWVDCEGYDLISIWGGKPYKAKAIAKREREERAKHLQSLKPKGPPQAVIPKMPHQIQSNVMATTTPSPDTPDLIPGDPVAFAGARTAVKVNLFDHDLSLPDFDDGTVLVDPVAQTRQEIDALMAQEDYAGAIALFAAERKVDRQFVLLPASLARLAAGLIRNHHTKAAIALLKIGSDVYPANAPEWRTRVASLYLSASPADPIAAIKHLKQVDKQMLNSKTRDRFLAVAKQAKEMARG